MIYTTSAIRGLLRIYDTYLADSTFPVSDKAPGREARGRVEFESKAPATACEVKADLERALETLTKWEALCVRCYRQRPWTFDEPRPGRRRTWRRATQKQRDGLADACHRMVAFLNGGYVPTEAEEPFVARAG